MINCDRWCGYLQENYKLPKEFRFTCGAANSQIIKQGESSESLVGRWRSDVRSIVSDVLCLAPEQKDVIDPATLDYGGMDPWDG